jgi:hypothetical protein
MNQFIAYPNETCVSLVIPTGELPLEQVAIKDVPADTPYIFVTEADLPDNHFYNAWEIVSEKIQVNLNKAKELHKEKIRVARKPLFETLDVQFQRALEDGEDTKEIVAQKKALRDATVIPDTIKNTEELKDFWNEELLGASPYV